MNYSNHNNTEPASADKRATKAANKAPAKDQPSTHVEGSPPVAGGRLFAFDKHKHAMRLRDFIISAILATLSATSCLAYNYDKDVVIYEGSVASTKVKITASERPFSRAAHKTTEPRKAEKRGWVEATVDGKKAVGTFLKLPEDGLPQLSALTVWFGDKKVSVPEKHLHHVFLPSLKPATFDAKDDCIDTIVAFSADAKALYLSLHVGDGAGSGTYDLVIREDGTVRNEPILRPSP